MGYYSMSDLKAAPDGGEAVPPPAKKPFEFKKSALSAKADQMWSQSRSGFTASATSTHIQLEKKSLSDVLGKMVADKKEMHEKETKPLFIFGSKISERVIIDRKDSDGENENDDAPARKAEDLFKDAAQKPESKDKVDRDFRTEAVEEAEKLKEQEKQHASTSIVAVTTGEEDDETIFQNACKLHSFDKERKTWVEKGLSIIKISKRQEIDETQYRIVGRTSGNHRVVINSKVFPDMLLERVDQKRIKISAMGVDSAIQVFLITIGFSKTDINTDQLFCTLTDILSTVKETSTMVNRKRKADDDVAEHSDAKKESDFAEYDRPVADGTGFGQPTTNDDNEETARVEEGVSAVHVSADEDEGSQQ